MIIHSPDSVKPALCEGQSLGYLLALLAAPDEPLAPAGGAAGGGYECNDPVDP
jgi:hypothetical protein